MTEERKALVFINGLSPESAKKVLAWIEMERGPIKLDTSRMDDSADVRSMVKLNGSIPGGSGAEWAEWATCRVLPKGTGGQPRHVRIHINLGAVEGTVKTPAKPSAQGARLKRLLTEDEWERLKDAASITEEKRANVKLWCHHVACKANGQDVPLNVGRGGSIDHLCDQDGCITPQHCLPTGVHKENTDRINCRGVGLHCLGAVITGVVPCKHTKMLPDKSPDVLSGCRRLYLIPAPDVYVIRPGLEDDLDIAMVEAVENNLRRTKRKLDMQ